MDGEIDFDKRQDRKCEGLALRTLRDPRSLAAPADSLGTTEPSAPKMTERQAIIRDRIEAAVKSAGCREIVYRSEYLGYLPFGIYHWIECGDNDVKNLPIDFSSDDLSALEQSGFLEKVREYTNPQDDLDHSTWYRVCLESAS